MVCYRNSKLPKVYYYPVCSGFLPSGGQSPTVTFDPAAQLFPLHAAPPLLPLPPASHFVVRNVERRIKEYNGTISEVIGAEAAIPGTVEVSEAIFFYSLIMAENKRRVKNILHSFFHPRTDPG